MIIAIISRPQLSSYLTRHLVKLETPGNWDWMSHTDTHEHTHLYITHTHESLDTSYAMYKITLISVPTVIFGPCCAAMRNKLKCAK